MMPTNVPVDFPADVPVALPAEAPPITAADARGDVGSDREDASRVRSEAARPTDGAAPPLASPPRRARVRSSVRRARERRTVTKLVRLSPAEARRIERRALACGWPVAC